MFKPVILKILAFVCFTGSIIGFAYTLYNAYPSVNWEDYITPVSWFLMILAGYWAIKVVQHPALANNLKKTGWYIYSVALFLVLFTVIKLNVGILPSLFLAFGLKNQSREIDERIKTDKNR